LLNSSKFLYILILYSSLRYYLFPYTTLFRSCQLHVTQSLRTFQAQQSTADHRATLGAAAAFLHRLQIIDGAIDETVLAVAAGYERDKGRRTGGDYQLIVRELFAVRAGHGPALAVYRAGAHIQLQFNVVPLEEAGRHQRQRLGAFPGKVFRQVHAVIGRIGFLAQDGDAGVLQCAVLQRFQELVADHAVTDDDDFHANSLSVE